MSSIVARRCYQTDLTDAEWAVIKPHLPAASHFSMFNLAWSGDNIVSSTDLYGGTWNLFANTLKQQGIEYRFVDPQDPEAFREATDDRTRAHYAETLPNPKLHVFPIAEVAEIGHEFGIPRIMDNTATTIVCQPFEHGAAINLLCLQPGSAAAGTA